MNDDLLGLASYIVRCANRFFRIIRSEGIWIEGSASAAAKTAGMEMNDTWIYKNQSSTSITVSINNDIVSGFPG